MEPTERILPLASSRFTVQGKVETQVTCPHPYGGQAGSLSYFKVAHDE
jgi:hypothetical protein